MNEAPKRRFHLTIEAGADEERDLTGALYEVIDTINALIKAARLKPGNNLVSVCGSPSYGHTVVIRHDPEMTHDRYFEAIQPFLSKNKEKQE